MTVAFIAPNWPAPDNIKAISTCRGEGFNEGGFGGLNLALHVGDLPANVEQNRSQLIQKNRLPTAPVWLNQVHGVEVIELTSSQKITMPVTADAAFSKQKNQICTVMTADCLPVLLCKQDGSAVAAVHAGWRGLLSGIIEKSVQKLTEPEKVMAWLGPAIGPANFEVGKEVQAAFVSKNKVFEQAFRRIDNEHFLADLYALARMVLVQQGVTQIYGGEHCTVAEADFFYSYRRDKTTGRMASLIWIDSL